MDQGQINSIHQETMKPPGQMKLLKKDKFPKQRL